MPTVRIHFPTLAQFILSGLGILLQAFSFAALLVVGGIAKLSPELLPQDTLSIFNLSAGMLLQLVLCLPSLAYSGFRLFDRRLPVLAIPQKLGWILVLAIPTVLGMVFFSQTSLDWVLNPVLLFLSLLIPVIWILWWGGRGFMFRRPQRDWGVLAFSVILIPAFLIILELLILVVVFIAAGAAISTQPDVMQKLMELNTSFASGNLSSEESLELVRPFIQRPEVILSGLAIFSIVLPLLEELFKPAAVWVLLKKKPTPAEGWWAGMLAGAAFALAENISAVGSQTGWGIISIWVGRFGTTLLHMTTTALLGWALASAFQKKKFAPLAGTFLLAWLLHGVWNFFGLAAALAPLAVADGTSGSWISAGSVVVMVLLSILNLGILYRQNRALRDSTCAVEQEDELPAPSESVLSEPAPSEPVPSEPSPLPLETGPADDRN